MKKSFTGIFQPYRYNKVFCCGLQTFLQIKRDPLFNKNIFIYIQGYIYSHYLTPLMVRSNFENLVQELISKKQFKVALEISKKLKSIKTASLIDYAARDLSTPEKEKKGKWRKYQKDKTNLLYETKTPSLKKYESDIKIKSIINTKSIRRMK